MLQLPSVERHSLFCQTVFFDPQKPPFVHALHPLEAVDSTRLSGVGRVNFLVLTKLACNSAHGDADSNSFVLLADTPVTRYLTGDGDDLTRVMLSSMAESVRPCLPLGMTHGRVPRVVLIHLFVLSHNRKVPRFDLLAFHL